MSNKMSKLLDKIERRLGTEPLNLPDHLKKDKWASKVIENETLDTFSNYFPHLFTVRIDDNCKRKNGYYLLDDVITDNVELLGVRDINWQDFATASMGCGYGSFDSFASSYALEDVALMQMRADHASMFDRNIYIDFKLPNMIRFLSATGGEVRQGIRSIPLDLLIKHPANLMTIEPTKMEIFEALAQADVARFLYSELKYFDEIETVYANIELKLSDLEAESNKRDDVIQLMKEGFVSAANKNQPMILCV